MFGDLELKRGQIAHLDQDAENDALGNLAFLCLPHHDEFDSRTSQSKGLVLAEVKKYRAELYAQLENSGNPAVDSNLFIEDSGHDSEFDPETGGSRGGKQRRPSDLQCCCSSTDLTVIGLQPLTQPENRLVNAFLSRLDSELRNRYTCCQVKSAVKSLAWNLHQALQDLEKHSVTKDASLRLPWKRRLWSGIHDLMERAEFVIEQRKSEETQFRLDSGHSGYGSASALAIVDFFSNSFVREIDDIEAAPLTSYFSPDPAIRVTETGIVSVPFGFHLQLVTQTFQLWEVAAQWAASRHLELAFDRRAVAVVDGILESEGQNGVTELYLTARLVRHYADLLLYYFGCLQSFPLFSRVVLVGCLEELIVSPYGGDSDHRLNALTGAISRVVAVLEAVVRRQSLSGFTDHGRMHTLAAGTRIAVERTELLLGSPRYKTVKQHSSTKLLKRRVLGLLSAPFDRAEEFAENAFFSRYNEGLLERSLEPNDVDLERLSLMFRGEVVTFESAAAVLRTLRLAGVDSYKLLVDLAAPMNERLHNFNFALKKSMARNAWA